MVTVNETVCPCCGGDLKYYDRVLRIVRTKGRKTKYIEICRLQCVSCSKVHREIPDFLLPYKRYEKELVKGVVEGTITSDTIGYEDYPCEVTMERWRTRNLQCIL